MIPVVQRDIRELPLELVDDPEIAMRDTFDDVAYWELVESIRQNGIQICLIVEQRGERFRISAGHRRATAARHLQMVTVPCDVRQPGALDAEAIKVLENDDREKVNAADAAVYLHRLYTERCDNDVDKLCALVRRERRYVEERLNLIIGDQDVFEAVKARAVSFGVAQELNRITNVGYRRLHLDNARKYGMTVAAAKEARKTANFATSNPGAAPDTSSSSSADQQAAQPSPYSCYICRRGDKVERMRYVMVHEHCDLAIGERVLAGFRHADVEPEGDGVSHG